jgi:hypothetical protein
MSDQKMLQPPASKKPVAAVKKTGIWAGIGVISLCGICCTLPAFGIVLGVSAILALTWWLLGLFAVGIAGILLIGLIRRNSCRASATGGACTSKANSAILANSSEGCSCKK